MPASVALYHAVLARLQAATAGRVRKTSVVRLALLANRADEAPAGPVTLAGKYCESGDVLIKDAPLPEPRSGDLVALPASGAYNLAMSRNYNWAYRPAVVVVNDGRARLVRRRETIEDLLAAEL